MTLSKDGASGGDFALEAGALVLGDQGQIEGPFAHVTFHAIFHAILRTKPAPAYPAQVFSHVTLRQNTAMLAEIG